MPTQHGQGLLGFAALLGVAADIAGLILALATS